MKMILKDDRIKELKVKDNVGGENDKLTFLEALNLWCNQHYQGKAQDKGLIVELAKAERVGSFFPDDMEPMAEAWNTELAEYCGKMYDYLNAYIQNTEGFWAEQALNSQKKQELLRLARLANGIWDDTAKFFKLGFDNDSAQLSPEEIEDIHKNPTRYAFVEGQLKLR